MISTEFPPELLFVITTGIRPVDVKVRYSLNEDAVHLVASFEHQPHKDGRWNFTRWDLVDLSQLKVKLKAEFQGSNRDMYRPEAVVATSAK